MFDLPRRALAALPALAVLFALVVLLPAASAAPSVPGFAAPAYVDQTLAGGEPTIFADTLHGRLIYTSHEGTTHLYRDGLVSSPWGDFSFVSNY